MRTSDFERVGSKYQQTRSDGKLLVQPSPAARTSRHIAIVNKAFESAPEPL